MNKVVLKDSVQLLDLTSLLKRSWEQFLYVAAACRSHFLHRGFQFVYVAAAVEVVSIYGELPSSPENLMLF